MNSLIEQVESLKLNTPIPTQNAVGINPTIINGNVSNTYNIDKWIIIEDDSVGDEMKSVNPGRFIIEDDYEELKITSLDQVDYKYINVTPRADFYVPQYVIDRIQEVAMRPRVKVRKCVTCEKKGYFYKKGDTETSACLKHKSQDMVIDRDGNCLCCYQNPSSHAMFFHRRRTICFSCCNYFLGYARLNDRNCRILGCNKRTCFNYVDETFGLLCSEHKLNFMIDVTHDKCREKSCGKRSIFNYDGEKIGLYCFEHKLVGMVSVVDRKCSEKSCNIRSNFNYEGETTGLYCSKHRLSGMIDIICKRCIYQSCQKHPSYNYKGLNRGLYCLNHKLDNMVNVISKRCAEKLCDKRPNYNYEGEIGGLYCLDHKLVNMIDIKHKRCMYPNCLIRPHFNKIGLHGDFCKEHASSGSVCFPYKICKTEGCRKPCVTGLQAPRLELMHCLDHIEPGEIDFTKNKCNTCNSTHTVLDIMGNCEHCSTLGTRVELRVRTFLIQNGIQYKSHDAPLPICRYRPDFLFETPSSYLIAEVDEYQHSHKHYTRNKDEDIRMLTIAKELGKPTIFIRFNPDEYKSPHQYDFDNRLQALKYYLNIYLNYTPSSLCEKIYLFYDGWDSNIVRPIPVIDTGIFIIED